MLALNAAYYGDPLFPALLSCSKAQSLRGRQLGLLKSVTFALSMPPFNPDNVLRGMFSSIAILVPTARARRLGHLVLASIERIRPLPRPLLAPWACAERTRVLVCPFRHVKGKDTVGGGVENLGGLRLPAAQL